MRSFAVLASFFVASPAWAGGIGLLVGGGARTEQIYYYTDSQVPEGGGPAVAIDDPKLWPQYQLNTLIGQGDGGLEVLLGDRDDKIVGVFRFYYQGELKEPDPKTMDISELDPAVPDAESVHAETRQVMQHNGVASVGLSWGIFGSPDTWQLGVSGQLGSGFLSTNSTTPTGETTSPTFLQANLGPTVTYKVARQVQLFSDLTYQLRYHKTVDHGANLMVGARYLFD
jgi:hypothetical protein